MATKLTMAQIRAKNKAAGHTWFDRAHHSRFASGPFSGNGGVFFCEYKQDEYAGNGYTVAQFHEESGDIHYVPMPLIQKHTECSRIAQFLAAAELGTGITFTRQHSRGNLDIIIYSENAEWRFAIRSENGESSDTDGMVYQTPAAAVILAYLKWQNVIYVKST
jgi:hypothetical protein